MSVVCITCRARADVWARDLGESRAAHLVDATAVERMTAALAAAVQQHNAGMPPGENLTQLVARCNKALVERNIAKNAVAAGLYAAPSEAP